MLSSDNLHSFFNKNDEHLPEVKPFNLINGLIYIKDAFKSIDQQSDYFSAEKLKYYKLTIKDGILYDFEGMKVDGRVIYVIDENGDLYGEKFFNDMRHENYKTKHSYFKSGQPVKGAGFFEVNDDGKIEKIDNDSGHYSPTLQQMIPALEYFAEHGCVNDVEFINHEFSNRLGKFFHYNLQDILSYKNHFEKNNTIPDNLLFKKLTSKLSSVDAKLPNRLFSRNGANPIRDKACNDVKLPNDECNKKRKNLDNPFDESASITKSHFKVVTNSSTFHSNLIIVGELCDGYDDDTSDTENINKKQKIVSNDNNTLATFKNQ